jgi:hypothetical protein
MAEHRRVESKLSPIGTGMATEPERIDQVQQEQERRRRHESAPVVSFGDVIAQAPAVGALVDDPEAAAPASPPAPPPKKSAGPRPTDPRAAALHKRFQKS